MDEMKYGFSINFTFRFNVRRTLVEIVINLNVVSNLTYLQLFRYIVLLKCDKNRKDNMLHLYTNESKNKKRMDDK